jgi:hypothetical protein
MFRFFKCNIINGCRLSDIERFVHRDEVFYLNSHIACTSRSVNAALNSKWIIEITEKEASKTLVIPKFVEETKVKNIEEKTVVHSSESKSNNAAYERYQARLQRLAMTKKTEEVIEEDDMNSISTGKDFTKNSAAEIRIKNRSRKVKNIKSQEKEFIDEIVDMDRKGVQNKIDITRQLNENKSVPKSEQFLKKSKVEIKNELEKKLKDKIKTKNVTKKQKKAVETVVEPEIIEPVVETVDPIIETPEIENISVAKRGRPRKIKEDLIMA